MDNPGLECLRINLTGFSAFCHVDLAVLECWLMMAKMFLKVFSLSFRL